MEFQQLQMPLLPNRLDHVFDAHPGETGKLEHVGAQNYQRYFPVQLHQQLRPGMINTIVKSFNLLDSIS